MASLALTRFPATLIPRMTVDSISSILTVTIFGSGSSSSSNSSVGVVVDVEKAAIAAKSSKNVERIVFVIIIIYPNN